ncbi:hypothetical protein J4526_04740 [Desulfurococcaceae archaeon MEX13E-LK6-19]|nr:hypothetical protein J4526_04740 [Desulfurococcaceae archaeon MEX13E-LK6-19]
MSSKQSSTSGKSKELKIITKHVITIDDIKNDPRKIKLLYMINILGGISEKALQHLIYYMKEKDYDLGYNFIMLGTTPSSKDLHNDLVALLYVGLLETDPRRKLVVTSMGREFLQNNENAISDEEKEKIKNLIDELRIKIAPIDTEVELASRTRRARRRRLF